MIRPHSHDSIPNPAESFINSQHLMGEKIYECDLDITGITDYGVTMDDIIAGTAAIPTHGARFDLPFEGRASGRISGTVQGVDYVRMHADGRIELGIRAAIETDDGCSIAVSADGVAELRRGQPILDLSENICLITASDTTHWINAREVWGTGTMNLATGKVHIDAYLQ